MALIGNEYRYAQKILTGAVKEKNLFKALVILTKYFYFELKQTENEVKRNLLVYIKGVGGVVDDNTLDSIIRANISDKTTINTLDHITITIKEWETIQELGRTERERKLLFTLLCMYKVKIGLGYSDNGLVKVDLPKLNSMAHITLSKAERIDVLRYFIECGLIELNMGQLASRVKINYVNNDSKVLIEIKDFEAYNVYYEYLKKGGKLIVCKECGKLVRVTKYSSAKQCNDCYKKKENERAKEAMKEYRATK